MRGRCWLPALAATVLGFGWQLLTVHFNYQGNFTALFCTGSLAPVPPALAAEHIYVFPKSAGYDGQAYHYMAHDPLNENGTGKAVDTPATRYRRILLPGLAFLLALGKQGWVDRAYIACFLAFLFLGTYWVGRLLERSGRNTWFSMLYLLVPATLISLDRLTVDMALTTLALGFAFYAATGERTKLYLILLLAPLCRDTGVLLTAGWLIPLLARRRFREAAWWGTSLIPAAIWNLYVSMSMPHLTFVNDGKLIPFAGWLGAWLHPASYRLSSGLATTVQALDWLQLLGFLLAFLLALRRWREATQSPVQAACILFAVMGLLLPPLWQEDPFVARLFSPLLVLEFLDGIRAPMAMILPRVGVQFTRQLLGIARGIGIG